MIFEQISLDKYDDNLAVIEFINPPFNLLSSTMLEEISRATSFLINDSAVNSIIFYGGNKMFSAGLELEISKLEDDAYVLELGEIIENLYAKFEQNNLIITSAVCGFANGFGFDVFSNSNIKIISDSAKFSALELDTDFNFLAYYREKRLARGIKENIPVLNEMITARKTYTAREISQLVTVNKIVPMEEVLLTAIKYHSHT